MKEEGITKMAKFTVLDTALMMIFMLLQPLNHYPQGWRGFWMLEKTEKQHYKSYQKMNSIGVEPFFY